MADSLETRYPFWVYAAILVALALLAIGLQELSKPPFEFDAPFETPISVGSDGSETVETPHVKETRP